MPIDLEQIAAMGSRERSVLDELDLLKQIQIN